MFNPCVATNENVKESNEAERRFRAIFDGAFEFIGLLKPDGTVIEANQTALNYIGATPAEVIGQPFWETAWWKGSAEQQQRLKAAIAQAAAGKFVRFEAQHTGKDSTVDFIDFSLRPAMDAAGQVTYLIPEGRRITERKRAEEALRESEEEFRALFESATVGMVQADLATGKLLSPNNKFCQITGYSAKELSEKSFADITHPDDRSANWEGFQALVQGTVPEYHVEKRYIRKDGLVVWVRIGNGLIRDAKGKPIRSIATVEDITERKQAEEALRERENELRALFDSATVGMAQTDLATGKLCRANNKFCQITGYSAEELSEKSFSEITYPDDREANWEGFQAFVQGNLPEYHVEKRYIRKDGSVVWVRISDGLVRDANGKPIRSIATVEDITERKQAEEAGAILAAIVSSANDAIISTRDGVIQTWNKGAERLLGWSAAEAIGQHVKMLMPPTHRDEMRDISTRLNRGEPVPHFDTVRQRKDGSLVDVSLAISPVKLDGQVIGASAILRDITERRLAQAALRASEERWRALLASIPGMVFTANADGKNDFVNDYFYTYTGVSRDSDLRGKWVQSLHPNDRERAYARWMQSIQTGEPYENELRFQRHDEVYRWFRSRAVALRDEHGQIIKWAGSAVDIEDIKQIQLALRGSEERLQIALAVGRMGTWERDLSTRKSTWDSRMYEICGFEPGAAVDLATFDAHVHPDDLPGVKRAIDQTIQTGAEYRYEFRFLRPDGRTVWLHGRGGLRCDANGTPTHLIGINFDITERKQAEQELHESEERFRLLAENIDRVFWFAELDPERVIYVSPAFEQLWGVPANRLYENPHLRIETIHPEDRSNVEQAFENWVAGRADTYDIEYRILRQDGEVRWMHDRGIVIGFRRGRPYKLGGIVKDITERKQVEEERTAADRRKDEFIATLAHELRNPLAPIRNVISLLQMQGSLDPNICRARDVISRQIDHLTRLIDDLLDVSRITSDKLELRKERVHLAEVVSLAVESSHPLIDQHHHKLSLLLPGEPIYLNADKVRLAQVIMNLLSNAAKYTPEGGRITLSAEHSGDEVVFRVTDNGVGIPPDQLSQIFDMFYQANRSYEQLHGGLGIGLTLTRRLVEMHGGQVEAHSAGINQGSEFVIRLPIFVEEPRPQKESPRAETTGTTVRRILVVDDYGENAETLAELLRFEGNEVEIANDGLKAVQIAETFRPAVVLLDIGMPNLDGYEAARKIREQPWGKSMVLIAVTGWGQENDRHRSRQAGFDAHLLKPVNYPELAKLIADLSGRRSTDA
jgi:PAS domain S-box-containing protein